MTANKKRSDIRFEKEAKALQKNLAQISGKAAFLAPLIKIFPSSFFPPIILILSITSVVLIYCFLFLQLV